MLDEAPETPSLATQASVARPIDLGSGRRYLGRLRLTNVMTRRHEGEPRAHPTLLTPLMGGERINLKILVYTPTPTR